MAYIEASVLNKHQIVSLDFENNVITLAYVSQCLADDRLLALYGRLSVGLSVTQYCALYLSDIHPTVTVADQMNRKCRLETRFFNYFQPLRRAPEPQTHPQRITIKFFSLNDNTLYKFTFYLLIYLLTY